MHDSECDNGSSEHAEPYPANHASARWRIRAAGATCCGLRMVKVAESSWLAVAQRMLMQLEADEREAFEATFDRIVKPPPGISIPRSVLFKSVDEIVMPDKYTVTFRLSEPRPVNFIMSSIASG
jgi:hypothetical protein